MNVLTALVLSITLAEADPATPQRLDSEACIASRLKICETLVDEGYARHGGFSLKGDAIVPIEAAIAAEACPALLEAEGRLASAGCQLKREVELTRQAAARSSAQYRQCQRRFPEKLGSHVLDTSHDRSADVDALQAHAGAQGLAWNVREAVKECS